MKTLFNASLLLACLALSACDSSGSSPTSGGQPNGYTAKANGTLIVGDRSIPILVSALYDDTSMNLICNSRMDPKTDSGWTLWLVTEPAKGTHPLDPDEPTFIGNTVTHDPGGAASPCLFQVTSGNVQLDSWNPDASAKYPTAEMSGSATVAYASSTSGCGSGSATISFADVLAAGMTE